MLANLSNWCHLLGSRYGKRQLAGTDVNRQWRGQCVMKGYV